MDSQVVNILPPSGLAGLNDYEKVFDVACGANMLRIYRIKGWNGKDIAQHIPGVRASTWKSYTQSGNTKNRSLHVVAAFCWLAQTTMSAIYRGTKVSGSMELNNDTIHDIIISASHLPPQIFSSIVDAIQSYILDAGIDPADINDDLEQLSSYSASDFLMPDILDFEVYTHDFYRAIGISLKAFREKNNFTIEDMASAFNVSSTTYQRYEDPENPYRMPMHMLMRFKLGFQLKELVCFSYAMEKFPELPNARTVQGLRSNILTALLSPLDPELQLKLKELVAVAAKISK